MACIKIEKQNIYLNNHQDALRYKTRTNSVKSNKTTTNKNNNNNNDKNNNTLYLKKCWFLLRHYVQTFECLISYY